MDKEAQRIKIAKACGYKTEREQLGSVFVYRDENSAICASLPNYLKDLNAMHSAEETLDANECAEYARQLSKHHPTYCVSVLENGAELEDIAYQTWSIIHATAEQRAEAFLRTKRMWVEDKP